MDVSIEQLAAFAAAAEHGSFSAAGRALGKAQSAVSTQVANLEIDLGVQLFDRSGRNPVLTPAGARLLPEARVILDRRTHLIGVAASLEAHVENRLTVAFDELYPESAIGRLCADFAGHFPHVELHLLFPMVEDVGRLVLDGKAELGLMWRQEQLPAELGFQTLGWMPLQLVCGRDHALARGPVGWEDLKRNRQLMVAGRGGGPEKRRLRVAAEVWWVESHWVILQILRQGVGWALIPGHIVQNSPLLPELATPALQFDRGDHPVALEMVWHKHRPTGPAAQWLRGRLAAARFDAASSA